MKLLSFNEKKKPIANRSLCEHIHWKVNDTTNAL